MASWFLSCIVVWFGLLLLRLNVCYKGDLLYNECCVLQCDSLRCVNPKLLLFCHLVVSDPKCGYPSIEDCLCSGEIVNYLLLLCGDISTNPGPIQHLCTVCSWSIRSNQCALQCDNSNLWSHARCVGVNASLYRELQLQGDFCWQCPSCLFSVLPGTEVCIDEPQSPISCAEIAIPSNCGCFGRDLQWYLDCSP